MNDTNDERYGPRKRQEIPEFLSYNTTSLLPFFCNGHHKNGYKQFDFGRSTPGEGTYEFKEQWGSSPIPLHWLLKFFNKTLSSENIKKSRKKEMVARLWSSLPLVVASFFGPKIRK